MANVIERGTLMPPVVTGEMFNLVRGKSSLARLSGAAPIPFNGERVFTFNFDKEVDLVAESGAKGNGGGDIAPVIITPVKVEYGMRVSDEFIYAADETRLQYLRAFSEGFANKIARGIDIMAFHGVNPRTGNAADSLTGKYFDTVVSNVASKGNNSGTTAIEAAIALVTGAEHDVTGLAMSNTMRNFLAAEKKGTASNEALYPELAWGSQPSVINGLPTEINSTVSYAASTVLGYVGNFRDFFRWGYSKQIPIEVIQYGNPDNDADAGDLKGHNQVYLRGEAYVGWGIIAPAAFARIISPAVSLSATEVTISTETGTTLTATTVPSGGTATWKSSDTSKVTVAAGVLTGVAAGTAVVTATYQGAVAACEVTVTT